MCPCRKLVNVAIRFSESIPALSRARLKNVTTKFHDDEDDDAISRISIFSSSSRVVCARVNEKWLFAKMLDLLDSVYVSRVLYIIRGYGNAFVSLRVDNLEN